MLGHERLKRTTTADDADIALALALAETRKKRGSEAQVQHSNDGSALRSDSDGYTGQLYEHTGLLLCMWHVVPISAERVRTTAVTEHSRSPARNVC